MVCRIRTRHTVLDADQHHSFLVADRAFADVDLLVGDVQLPAGGHHHRPEHSSLVSVGPHQPQELPLEPVAHEGGPVDGLCLVQPRRVPLAPPPSVLVESDGLEAVRLPVPVQPAADSTTIGGTGRGRRRSSSRVSRPSLPSAPIYRPPDHARTASK